MATWPFWLLFLGAGALALLVVKRFDDLERRQSKPPPGSAKPRKEKQT